MAGLLISAIHALLVSTVLSALVSLDISLAAKVVLGALSGLLVLVLVTLREQTEQLHRIYTTLRATSAAVEAQRLNPQDKRRAMDILSVELEQEKSDQEIKSALSGSSSNGVVYWFVYLIAVAIMTVVGTFLWSA